MLQKVYHKLQEWIIMLDTSEFSGTDASLIKEEMIKLCGEIWNNKDAISELNEGEGKLKEVKLP